MLHTLGADKTGACSETRPQLAKATNWYESLLGHLAMAWVFALLALAAGCDLEPWLQEVPEADRGYHVLCVGPEAADLRAGGLAAAEPRQLALGDFSARLEAELRIKSRLVFQLPSGQGEDRKPPRDSPDRRFDLNPPPLFWGG